MRRPIFAAFTRVDGRTLYVDSSKIDYFHEEDEYTIISINGDEFRLRDTEEEILEMFEYEEYRTAVRDTLP